MLTKPVIFEICDDYKICFECGGDLRYNSMSPFIGPTNEGAWCNKCHKHFTIGYLREVSHD